MEGADPKLIIDGRLDNNHAKDLIYGKNNT
jgi:hypothetical protein